MSNLSPQQKRDLTRRMMAEDETPERAGPVASGSILKAPRKASSRESYQRPSTPPPSALRSPQRPTASGSSPSLALRFDGKVYRTLSPGKGVNYSPDANFFGAPDETVEDADNAKADRRRRELEREMRVASSSKRRRMVDSSDDELVIKQPKFSTTPTKRAVPNSVLLSPPKPRSPFDIAGPPGPRPSQPALGAPFTLGPAFGSALASELPKPLADLLALHNAIESTLLLHLAASGALVASSLGGKQAPDGSTTIRMPALIDLPDLAKKLASGGKRCTEAELAKLVWVWQGCGQSEHSDEDSDDELTVEKGGKGLEPGEAGGMGFIVSKMRVNGPTGIVGTYGVGLSVQVRTNVQRPKIELVPPPSPQRSPRRRTASAQSDWDKPAVGARDGMAIVALWTSGVAGRRKEFTRRLKGWLQRETDKGPPPTTDGAPLSPSRTFIPSIPLASLPTLAHAIPTVPGTPSPSPHKPKLPPQVMPGLTAPATPSALSSAAAGPSTEGETDVFGPVIVTPKSKAPPKGVKGRRNAMRERLEAKQAAQAALPSVALPTGAASLRKHDSTAAATERRVAEAAALKRRSMLSRLPAIADVVWMLFDVGQKSNMRLMEVASAVAKSAASGSSEGEAKEALVMLAGLCPGFVGVKVVGQQEWLGRVRGMELKEVKAVVRDELARSYPATAAVAMALD